MAGIKFCMRMIGGANRGASCMLPAGKPFRVFGGVEGSGGAILYRDSKTFLEGCSEDAISINVMK